MLARVLAPLFLLHSLSAPTGCQARLACNAVPFPSDFAIEAVAGGVHPWEETHTVRVSADGRGAYTRYVPHDVGAPPLVQNDFTLIEEEVASVWEVVKQNGFFSLDEDYRDRTIRGGSVASVTITAEGTTHRVRVQNVSLQRFEAVLAAINAVTPEGNDLIFRSPD